MTTTHDEDRPAKSADSVAIEQAIRESVREAVRKHRLFGLPMVEARDGEVVWVPADELPS